METTEAIVVVLVTGMIFGIPLLGITLRFSLKPLVEAFIRLREAQIATPQIQMLRDRVEALEHQLEIHGLLDRPGSKALQQLASEHLPGAAKDRERI